MTVEAALMIIDTALKPEKLNNLQELIFRQSWQGKSYQEIAASSGYNPEYVKDVGYKLWQLLSKALGEKITKSNCRAIIRCRAQQAQALSILPIEAERGSTADAQHQDWGEAVDVSIFYGRTEELATLAKWVLQDHCHLVAVLGMGGIGKTVLAVKLAEQVQGGFEYLIWRSLLHAPCIKDLLADLIQFLSNQQESEMDLPEDVGDRISRLIYYLRISRCLVILDNAEAILQSGEPAGHYRQGYEGYGELLKRVGEVRHPSCLVLTSREKPEEVAALEGEILPVRSLQLMGMQEAEAQEILKAKGLSVTAAETRQLIERYRGNPLALKIVATSVRELFAGNIAEFLAQGTAVFDGIRNLLAQQVNRLSDLEKQVMYWLAINREPVSLSELRADLVPSLSNAKLLEVLKSLRRRSLIEKATPPLIEQSPADVALVRTTGFTQQPVVMEYMTDRLIEQVCDEIATEQVELIHEPCADQGPGEGLYQSRSGSGDFRAAC